MRLVWLLMLVLCIGCIGTGQKQMCDVRYNQAGVAVTNMQVDYPQIYAGNKLRLSLEVANLGDMIAKNVKLYIIGPDNYFELPDGPVISSSSMAPPQPNECIEGELKSGLAVLESKKGKQSLEGVAVKLKLKYDYDSHAWADIVVLSEQQWNVRMQEGYVPKLYQYQSVAPIKIKMAVPAVPVIENSEFQVVLSLENVLASADATARKGTKEDVVESVTVTIPGSFEFGDSGECVKQSETTCKISGFKITTDPENVEEKKITIKLKDEESVLEENFKIKVDAEYTYEVFYNTEPIIIISD